MTGPEAPVQKTAAARQAQRTGRPEPRLPKAVAARAKLESSAHQQKVRVPAAAVHGGFQLLASPSGMSPTRSCIARPADSACKLSRPG